MDRQHRREIIAWVANHVLPHEADVRTWLRRAGVQPSDIDDIVQQSYCILSALTSVNHIDNGRAYFFATARSVRLQRFRRERVAPLHVVIDAASIPIADDAPSPEQAAHGRRRLAQVLHALNDLPSGYRETITLRRLDGLTQKETARRLGVSEKIVENNLARGLKALLRAIAGSADAEILIQGDDGERRRATRH